jgi:outer membrane lipoprotein-sorting protein
LKKQYRWLAAWVITTGLSGLAGSSEAALNSAQFDVLQQQQQQGSNITVNMHVWIKGEKARVEMDHPMAGKQIWISDGKDFYMLSPTQKAGQKRPLPKQNGKRASVVEQITGSVNQLISKGKKVGRATVEGVACDVYTGSFTGPQGGSSSFKAWIGSIENTRLPLKVEQKRSISRPNANFSSSQSMTIKNLRTNPSIPDSQFAIPSGYKITTMPNQPPGMAPPGKGGPGPR